MRASRLLRLLLVLQNRGKQTCAQLSRELEVTRRTVLRDVDALTEAGLPVVVHRGPKGGIELGFNYRTRLTGLTATEAEALAVVLAQPVPALEALGLADAARTAVAKLVESFPDGVRAVVAHTQARFTFSGPRATSDDERVPALAQAIRDRRKVRINARVAPRVVHPVGLRLTRSGWLLIDALDPKTPIRLEACGDLNVSTLRFESSPR